MLRQKILSAALAVPLLAVGGAEAAKIGTGLNTAAIPGVATAANQTVVGSNTVSAQIFGGRTPNNLVLGNAVTATGKVYFIFLDRALRNGNQFGIEIDAEGAQFARSMLSLDIEYHARVPAVADDPATPDNEATPELINTTPQDDLVAGCAVSVRDTRVRISGCTVAGAADGPGLLALMLRGFAFDNAASLATAGNSITLSGAIVDPADDTRDYESITPTDIVKSANTVSVAVKPGAVISIDPDAIPPFSGLVGRQGVETEARVC